MKKIILYALATLFWIGLIFLGAAVDNLSALGIGITLAALFGCLIAAKLIDKEEESESI